jgi:isoamylase
MILGGDELGRTQGGNNNAYCQDNETSWYHWDTVDLELLSFTTELIALRRENPALRSPQFRTAPTDDVTDWVTIVRADAQEFSASDWDNPQARTITFVLGHDGGDAFALLLNAAQNGVEFTVPDAPNSQWELALSSDPGQVVASPVTTLIIRDASFTLLRSRGHDRPNPTAKTARQRA